MSTASELQKFDSLHLSQTEPVHLSMKLMRSETFTHKDKQYELRLYADGWRFTVQSFHNGERADGYSHSVDLPTAFDLQQAKNTDAIAVLFESAKNEIREENWERHVKGYLESLHLTEEQSIGCQKCTNRDIDITKVDGRKMYRCKTCGNVWYEPRKTTGATETFLDDITEGVISKGFYDIATVILLNMVFREGGRSPSFHDQLDNWCNQNWLRYETYVEVKKKKEEEILHFTRRLK